MKPDDYAKLEKDRNFKKSYLNKTPWWKNMSLIPPILLLFIGSIGIVYLLKNGILASLYVIPYAVFFVLGAILLKIIKRQIQKKKMEAPDSFRVCLAKPFWEKNGNVYVAFVNDAHRHNKHYINNLVKNISLDQVLEEYNPSIREKSQLLNDKESNISFYIRIFTDKDIIKQNAIWREEYLFPVLYVDNKYTFVIKRKDLSFYGK